MHRRFSVAFLLAACLAASQLLVILIVSQFFPIQAQTQDHVAPPARVATSYPAVDVHGAEHVAIAADPYNTREKIALFRVDYLKYDFLPVRIIVTNNSDHPISLADARINFITAAGDKIPTAEIPDVERRIDQIKRPDSGYKLPGPLPRIGNKSATKSKDIEDDFHSFEYSSVAVGPHSTSAGFLFYDLKGIANPLVGAKLNLTTLRDANGKELFYFEIPLDKYLAQPGSQAKY
ncbi:MAG TPA: hypothetical protein VGM27_21950 [Acidobacteriaceae bacterium]|jgi:hypothetical protein